MAHTPITIAGILSAAAGLGISGIPEHIAGDVETTLREDAARLRGVVAAEYQPLKFGLQRLGMSIGLATGIAIAIITGALAVALARQGVLPIKVGLTAIVLGSVACALVMGLVVWPLIIKPSMTNVVQLSKNDIANVIHLARRDFEGLGITLSQDLKKYGGAAMNTIEEGIKLGYKPS